MDFLKEFMGNERKMLEEQSLDKLITMVYPNSPALSVLKEKITVENVNENIIGVKDKYGMEVNFYPLYWAIKSENPTVIDYLFEIGAENHTMIQDRYSSLEDTLKNIETIETIKALQKRNFDFRNIKINMPYIEFSFFKRNQLRENGKNMDKISYLGYSILSAKKSDFIDGLLEANITPHIEDALSPLEALIQTYNSSKKNLIKRFASKEVEQVIIDAFYDVIISNLNMDYKMDLLKLFVEDLGLDLNKEATGTVPLLTNIQNHTNKDNEKERKFFMQAIKYSKELNNLEEYILKKFSKEELEELKGTKHYKTLNLETYEYEEFMEQIKNNTLVDEKPLRRIVFSADYSMEERINLVNAFAKSGGDMNEEEFGRNVLVDIRFDYENEFNALIPVLIENGTNIEHNGMTALFGAISRGNMYQIKLFLENNANPNFIENGYSWQSYLYSKRLTSNKKLEILKVLLEYGMDLNMSYISENGTETSILFELIANEAEESDKDINLINYIIENNLGDFTLPRTTLKLMIKTDFFKIEYIKKAIKTAWQYEEYNYYKEKSMNILEIALNRKEEELINHIIDEYPQIKVREGRERVAIAMSIGNGDKVLSLKTVEKIISHNSHLLQNKFLNENKTSRHTFITNFAHQHTRGALRSSANLKRYKEILSLLIKYGVDINIPSIDLEYENKNSFNESTSILQWILLSMYEEDIYYNMELIEFLYESGFDPITPIGSMKESPLMNLLRCISIVNTEAGEEATYKIFKYFGERFKIDFEQRNRMGTTYLLQASMIGSAKLVKWMIEKGADQHAIGGFDNSPALHKAISNYNDVEPHHRAKVVKVLLDAGVNKEEICNADHFTPLMSAAHYGATECVQILLDAEVDPNNKNADGLNAAQCAVDGECSYDFPFRVESNKVKILTLLKQYGTDLNHSCDKKESPLCLAITQDKKEVFESLIRLDVDINAVDSVGRTPLMLAVEYADKFFVERLLQLNADINIKDNYNENVLVKALFRKNRNEAQYFVFKFLDENIDYNLKINESMNILHLMASNGMSDFISLFAKYIDINEQDNKGNTAVLWSISSSLEMSEDIRINVISELIKNDADINIKDNNGNSVLDWAIHLNYKRVTEYLIQSGISISMQNISIIFRIENRDDFHYYLKLISKSIDLTQYAEILFYATQDYLEKPSDLYKLEALISYGVPIDSAIAIAYENGNDKVIEVLQRLKNKDSDSYIS